MSTRKFLGPTSRVSPAVIAPKPNKDDVHIHVCVNMIRANEAILGFHMTSLKFKLQNYPSY